MDQNENHSRGARSEMVSAAPCGLSMRHGGGVGVGGWLRPVQTTWYRNSHSHHHQKPCWILLHHPCWAAAAVLLSKVSLLGITRFSRHTAAPHEATPLWKMIPGCKLNHTPARTDECARIRLLVKATRDDMLLHIRTRTPAPPHTHTLPLSLSLQVNTESQMASGAVQNELASKAWCCESLAFYKRSVARRRPPESQETAFGAHTLIRNNSLSCVWINNRFVHLKFTRLGELEKKCSCVFTKQTTLVISFLFGATAATAAAEAAGRERLVR